MHLWNWISHLANWKRGISTDTLVNNTTPTSEGEELTFDDGVSVGGTGLFDDYDATADAEAG